MNELTLCILKVAFTSLTALFVLPPLIYVSVKLGTYGYFQGKHLFHKNKED